MDQRDGERIGRSKGASGKSRTRDHVASLHTPGGFTEENAQVAPEGRTPAMLLRAVEQSPLPVILTDIKGVIEYVNPAFIHVNGFSRDDVIGSNPRILKSGGTPPWIYADLWKTVSGGGVWRGELLNRRKDGRLIWVRNIIAPLRDEGGEPVHLLGIQEDVTPRKNAEREAASRMDELERRNRELHQFAYVASHDLREPLRTLVNYVELLRVDLPDQLSEEARVNLRFIQEAANRMDRMVKDLLALSRAGGAAFQWAEIDLNECVGEAVDNLDAALADSQGQVTWSELPCVMGDRVQLVRVFQNLVGNALTCRGMDPPRIDISALINGKQVVVSVSDNGVGVPEMMREEIFQPFKQVGKGEKDGAGMGLAIVRKLVQRLGGEIWVESPPSQGSDFKFSLSLRKGESGHG